MEERSKLRKLLPEDKKLSELCLWLQKADELDRVRMRQPPAPPAPGTPSPPSPPPPPLSSSRPDSFAKEDGDEICGDCGEASPSAARPTAALAEAALTAVCHDEAPCGHEERTQQRCQQSSATGAQWRLAARAEGVPVPMIIVRQLIKRSRRRLDH